MNAKEAIDESILRGQIVTIQFSEQDEWTLISEAEDCTANSGVTEFWGGKGDGEWRVHMTA
jgi:hypothetical protein